MWVRLQPDAQTEIVAYAHEYAAREHPTLHCGLDDPGKLFDDWGFVFTDMRYRYEVMEDETEEKQAQQEERLKTGAFDPEIADWRTWDGERDCMIDALLRYLNAPDRLNMWYEGNK